METTVVNSKAEASKNGIGLGLINLVIGILTMHFVAGASSMWTIILVPVGMGILLPIAISVFFSIDLRKKIGGFWNFRQAVSGIFLMLLVAFVISTAGSLAYTKLIDTGIEAKMQDNIKTMTVNAMKSQGVDDERLDKQMEDIDAKFAEKQNAGIVKQIQGFLIYLIFLFIYGLILAAILKKERPLFLQETDDFPHAKA